MTTSDQLECAMQPKGCSYPQDKKFFLFLTCVAAVCLTENSPLDFSEAIKKLLPEKLQVDAALNT